MRTKCDLEFIKKTYNFCSFFIICGNRKEKKSIKLSIGHFEIVLSTFIVYLINIYLLYDKRALFTKTVTLFNFDFNFLLFTVKNISLL